MSPSTIPDPRIGGHHGGRFPMASSPGGKAGHPFPLTSQPTKQGASMDIKKNAPFGKRAIVIVDRGWIFAGDVTEENGRIYLDRAVWVFKWTGGCGFSAIVDDPKKADVRLMPVRVNIPAKSEIYRVPVADNWGL